jgi:plasmid stability protein
MTLKLDIPKDTEAGLLAQAHAHGLSLEDYARQVLESAAVPNQRTGKPEAQPRKNLAQLLTESPFAGADLDLERRKDYARPIELGAPSKRPSDRKSLAQLFAESPFRGLDLKFERDPDTGRPLTL